MYRCTVIYNTVNSVFSYCYIQHRELCVKLYWCTVVYSEGNCVYNCIGVLLYEAQAVCTFVYSCTAL